MRRILTVVILQLLLTGCGPKRDLNSCADAGANGARMRCDGNRLMYCNAGTGFTYRATNGCAAGQTCYIGEDEKTGGCK